MVDPTPIRKETDTPDSEPVFPGVEAALVQSIDDKRSLSIKTLFLRDTPPQHHEKVLAELFSVTAVIGLREKLIELKREKLNAERRLSELRVDPEKRTQLVDEVNRLLGEASSYREGAEKRFRDSGRQGVFTPVGADKTKISGFVTDIASKRQELETLDLDIKRQRDELEKAIRNWGVAIENTESEIAIRREAYGA